MEINKISDDNGGSYLIITSPDVERVNPIEFYSNWYMTSDIVLSKELIHPYQCQLPFMESIFNKIISEKAKQNWAEKYQEIINTELPQSLKLIFSVSKKKEQEKLLRGLSLTTNQLAAFIFYAWTEHGYTFSTYKAEYQHKGVNEADLPTIIYVEGDEVNTIGNTRLTKGQQKQVIENRTVVISKFFDKGDNWHCFFITYDSLKGKESWQDGQPHFHYISDKFGISREETVKNLKDRRYNLGSLPHINLNDYNIDLKDE